MKNKVSIVSNVWIREIQLEEKGESYGGHSHTFDHQHLLAVGSISVTQEGVEEAQIFTAPQMIFIPRNKAHSFKALTDTTLGYCLHPIRDGHRIEDIVCPTMKVTLKDFFAPERSNANITALINTDIEGLEAELTEAKKWDIDKKEIT